jgi:predicted LPLAT superfamily acyltransferase
VVTYYFISNRRARSASKEFLQQVETFAGRKIIQASNMNSYRHFLSFAESMVDKLSAWNNKLKIEDVIIHGRKRIEEHMRSGEGCMILGSHLGNAEVCRALATLGEHVKLNILVHTKHAENFNRLLNGVSSENSVELIQVTDVGPELAIRLDSKLSQGEFVFIVGDRIPVSNHGRTMEADFLGRPAPFAQGPFILAALLKCPVYSLFCLKQRGVFNLYFDDFAERILLPRKAREQALQQYIQLFANQLEKYCLLAPLQWFNFYHYWELPKREK